MSEEGYAETDMGVRSALEDYVKEAQSIELDGKNQQGIQGELTK